MMSMKPVAYAVGCAVSVSALAGYSLIPDYHRPQLPVAATYPTGDAYEGASQSRERAVRVAALNVAAAQAQYRVQRSDLFPQISASGTGELGSLTSGSTNTNSTAIRRRPSIRYLRRSRSCSTHF
jgi:multidrug efflux system outer membrane protein